MDKRVRGISHFFVAPRREFARRLVRLTDCFIQKYLHLSIGEIILTRYCTLIVLDLRDEARRSGFLQSLPLDIE